jgi:uncharacterized protein
VPFDNGFKGRPAEIHHWTLVVSIEDKSKTPKTVNPAVFDRRTFLFGSAAAILDPPLPQRRRVRVAVIGDSVAEDLWFGLSEVRPKSAHYIFVQHGKASTGLTQPSLFDWPAKARELAQESWGAALILLGLNDNLPIKVEKKWMEAGTPAWRKVYGERAVDLMRSFTSNNIPLVWIGPPCVRAKGMDRGMLAIHDVLAERVPAAGGIFISSRDFTVGPDREYASSLEGGNGKSILLRHSDGVHFTSAGNRYLAENVLKALRADPKTASIFS